jgi:hypothetical protein
MNPVSKDWYAFVHPFLKKSIVSHYLSDISTSHTSLDDRLIFAIDDSLVTRIRNFVLQLEPRQTGLIVVHFPFNPEMFIKLRCGKEENNFDRKETLIFWKKISSNSELITCNSEG